MDSLPDTAGPTVKRHRLSTRLWHWLNALLLYILFASGLGIFNAHPRLYWGQYGANFDRAWLELERFGSWWTLPASYNLALSRHWHLAAAPIFAFALLAYMLWSLANRHVSRDLAFRKDELAPRHVWQDIRDHARLRFPTGAAALRWYYASSCALAQWLPGRWCARAADPGRRVRDAGGSPGVPCPWHHPAVSSATTTER